MERRIFSLMAVIPALAITCASGSAAAPQPSALMKALKEMDRSVCRSFKSTCKAKPGKHAGRQSAKRNAKPAPRPAIKPAAVGTPTEPAPKKILADAKPPAKTAETAPPLPRSKPSRRVAIILPPPAVIPKLVAPNPNDAAPNNSDDTCLKQLRAQGADFTIGADTVESGLCHVYNPVRLLSVSAQKRRVKLPEAPQLNCKYALQLSKWLRESAAPILAAQSNSTIDRISTGPGYQCRGRNGDASAKISEHGYGNAVDISSFHLADGRDILVQDAADTNASSFAVLRDLRASACGYFTTVLGPGSNAAHATHFHFDLGMHGKSATYRICE
jgi:hypothetical protein